MNWKLLLRDVRAMGMCLHANPWGYGHPHQALDRCTGLLIQFHHLGNWERTRERLEHILLMAVAQEGGFDSEQWRLLPKEGN